MRKAVASGSLFLYLMLKKRGGLDGFKADGSAEEENHCGLCPD